MADAIQPSEAKALRLARYLKEFVGLRTTTVYDVHQYESVLWFGDMPQEPGCQSPAWRDAAGTDDGDRGGPWLEVHKQQFPPRPAPPDIVLPWIDQQALATAAAEMPGLRPARLAPDYFDNHHLGKDHNGKAGSGEKVFDRDGPPLVELHLNDHPEVMAAYKGYRLSWEEWSRECQRRSRIQSVYAELFRVHTQVQKQGEVLELVLGFGLLSWHRPNQGGSPSILRHLVTAQVDLHFDAATGAIRLDCGADGAQLKIEDDMLDAERRPARGHYAAVADQLNALGDDVWNRSIFMALKSWAAALHPDSEWSADLRMAAGGENKPVVSFAPALILRRRTQIGMMRIYDALIDRLGRDTGAVPQGWLGLVEAEDGPEAAPAGVPSGAAGGSGEVYFPLPANREQRRIVDVISRHRGVLVQGPPGTGKSHTIANLVCHLLASGKRILITAETGRALKVLKEKLPEELRPLCVSLLGQGSDAFAELNMAVQGITTRFASWHEGAYDQRIADVDRELDENRRMLAEIDGELRRLREEETHSHSLLNGAYAGSASEIALIVAAERDRFGWLRLHEGAPEAPVVPGADMAAWLRVRRSYDNDAVAAAKLRVVGTHELPSTADFAAAVAAEIDARAAFDNVAVVRSHPAYAAIVALTEDDRAALAAKLREMKDSRESLQRRADGRLRGALHDALDGRQAGWQALLDQSLQSVAEIDQLLGRVGSHVVSFPETWDIKQVRGDVVAVYRHLREGGKWIEFGLYTPKAVKGRLYLRGPVTVDGLPADTAERLRIVCDHIDLILTLQALDLAWSDYGGLPPGAQPKIRMAAIKEHVDIFAAALDYVQTCIHLGHVLGATTPAIPVPDWLNGEADEFLDLIGAAALDDRYRRATDEVTAWLRHLKAARDLHGVHPVVGAMVLAIERRDVGAYSHAHQHVQRIEQAARDIELGQTIEAIFSPAVPGLTGTVAASLDDAAWDIRFALWEDAWRWALADNWLTRRADAAYREQLWQRRQEADEDIRSLLSEAASLRAWTHFFTRLSAPEAGALRAWRETVRSMGKGTGRSARLERLRQEARQYMDQCRDAIPVWIMPRYLVAEMIDPTPGRYDFVIVDEASQLSIESLFLFYISRKMIVVGDDQQISPYGMGNHDRSIADLQYRYLNGVPFHNAFSAQSSLYGNAKIRFAQNVVLREHFRCMPEIIQFSNDLCYANNGTPLDPLRTYPGSRLKPLVVRHVADGNCAGGEDSTNEAEADAILAQILACIADPRYAGRTMGVISLQGEAQAKLIENKLLQTLEPEVFEQRRLMCGDAYAFQGDERHIIFLSMVAAPGEARIGPLTTEQARQRFNVAASRAQDQLWLFHSIELDDLSPACMRHRLMSYMLNPGRTMADETRRRFESQFERDVFQVIADRGFHVRTQVCVGDPTSHRYRIDLVVEGMQGRLAVECEGDRWHGPDRYEVDLARQRDLERAGWQIVRVRGGDFYRDRTKALEPLWRALDRLGIRPGGIDDAAEEPPLPAAGRHDAESEEVQALTADAGRPANGVDASATGEAGPAGALVADYVPFSGTAGPDPRTVTLGEVVDGLCRIIDAEGPMIARRAYDVYLSGCGIRRLGGELQGTMNRALATAIGQGRVISDNVTSRGGLIESTVRSEGAPAIRPRRRGPRSFDEIPPGELRAVAEHISAALNLQPGSDEHLRAIVQAMDLPLMLAQVGEALQADVAAAHGDASDGPAPGPLEQRRA
jgi:very-short-patch-repair endonuclease